MKTTFFSQFEKDIEKLRVQSVKDGVAESIE